MDKSMNDFNVPKRQKTSVHRKYAAANTATGYLPVLVVVVVVVVVVGIVNLVFILTQFCSSFISIIICNKCFHAHITIKTANILHLI